MEPDYTCAIQTADGATRLISVPEKVYPMILDFLQMSEEIIAYYRSQSHEEDAKDYTFQRLQRALESKKWYRENPLILTIFIGITKQYVEEHAILIEYYEYILYCLKKDAEKEQEATNKILRANHMLP